MNLAGSGTGRYGWNPATAHSPDISTCLFQCLVVCCLNTLALPPELSVSLPLFVVYKFVQIVQWPFGLFLWPKYQLFGIGLYLCIVVGIVVGIVGLAYPMSVYFIAYGYSEDMADGSLNEFILFLKCLNVRPCLLRG